MKLRSNLVLLKVDVPKNQTDDGLFIEEEWKTLPTTGTVITVGEAVTFCKEGDSIEYERFGAIQSSQGEDYRICREDGILAVL